MRGNRRSTPSLKENPAVRRWYEDNETLLREARSRARQYAAHPLPETVENELKKVTTACAETGRVVKSEELCRIVEELSLTEDEIARFPDALTAILTAMSVEKHESEKVIQTVCRSLIMLEGLEHRLLFEAGKLHQLLMADPAGVYPDMHPRSQGEYRAALAKCARKQRISETEAAEQVLRLASAGKSARMRHIGYWILEKPLGKGKKSHRSLLYSLAQISFAVSAAAILCIWGGLFWSAAFPALLIFAENAIQAMTFRKIPRRPLPRMKESKTPALCVIVAMVTKAEQVTELAEKMEDYFLTAGNDRISLALLVDFAESRTATSEKDSFLRHLLTDAVTKLNAEYGERFYLFLRERHFSESDSVWRGWERKRGAILELCSLMRGKASQILTVSGDKIRLREYPYLIVLDEDSRPQVGALEELIAAADHPLNQPVFSSDGSRVAEGYGILNPNLKTTFPTEETADFALQYAGSAGFSRYSSSAGNRQFDMNGTIPFTGKGLIHVETFDRLMKNRFPENMILSHDLPEGEIMRTGFCAAAQISDKFPQTRDAYEKRRHRWIRGDVQNLRLLGETGTFRILSNVFTDLYDAADIQLALLAAWAAPQFLWVLGLSIFTPLISELCRIEDMLRNGWQRSFFSRSDSFRMAAKRCFDRLFHLPYSAGVTLDAAIRAGVRMLFTHRGLLEWSTAAQGGGPMKAGVFGMASGILVGILSGTPAGIFLAGCWTAGLFSDIRERFINRNVSRETGLKEQIPDVSHETSGAVKREVVIRETLSDKRRRNVSRETSEGKQKTADSLRKLLRDSVNYYLVYCTEKRHYLPPDNVQSQPKARIAERTSPTNVGLAMLSLYAGTELNVIDRDDMLELLYGMTESLEKWPKWKGHPYNWVDTRNLRALEPVWISTVDSGNLAFCLAALIQGELPNDLRDRVQRILDNMDFTALYDREKRLFRLGFHVEENQMAENCYDLINSEARLASYWAIAAGQVEAAHWEALKRPICKTNGYAGLASWSGTMFETALPLLFLPCFKGGIWRETVEYLCREQKKAGKDGLWGMSESGYFAFDEELNYQYKAHGVQKAAVRNETQEDVFAPYAAVMALPFAKEDALRALEAYKRCGLRDSMGFCEAFDWERGKIPVRSHMAHHQGMTVLAIWNVLNGGAVRLCQKDARLRAFLPLLAEDMPQNCRALPKKRPKKKEKKKKEPEWKQQSNIIDEAFPRLTILGNPAYRVFITDTGRSTSISKGITVAGLDFEEHFEAWLNEIPLYPHDLQGVSYSCTLSSSAAIHRMQTDQWRCRTETRVSAETCAEQRIICIQNRSKVKKSAVLRVLLTPILAKAEDARAHPAFSGMFLHTHIGEDGRSVTIHRGVRGKNAAVWAVFAASETPKWETRREAIPRGGKFPQKTEGRPDGYVISSRICAEIELEWEAGETKEVRFALSCGEAEETARSAAKQGLAMESAQTANRICFVARTLEMSNKETEEALEVYAGVLFGKAGGIRRKEALKNCRLPKTILWKCGISGEIPVIKATVEKENREALYKLLKIHAFLFALAAPVDLLLLCPDGGAYERPYYGMARALLQELNGENLTGIRGGVHLYDSRQLSVSERTALTAYSDLTVSWDDNRLYTPARTMSLPEVHPQKEDIKEINVKWKECEIRFTGMPPISWSHILSNRVFGWIATDAGTGFLWYFNARENKLNAWENDPYAVRGPETIFYRCGNRSSSAFSENGDAEVTYGCGYAVWEKNWEGHRYRMTAYVHPVRPARILLFETDAESAEICYHTTLQMGADRRSAQTVITEECGKTICAENPGNGDYAPYRTIFTSYPHFIAEEGTESNEISVRVPIEHGRAVLVLGCAADFGGLEALEALTEESAAREGLRETKEYWKKMTESGEFPRAATEQRRYLDGFALYQVIAVRLWGRTSLWQNGGAYGFRDQLQDVIALLEAPPEKLRYEIARAQILRCAARQYEEGDVQHWWHPRRNGLPRGVRTRITDDLLFLPWVTALYTQKVQDNILDVRIPYLESSPLGAEEHDRYEEARYGRGRESVYEHCVRALELIPLRGTGIHGLLRMGSGDWNDGMDEVQGESVWLTLFASAVYRDFAEVARKRGDEKRADRYHDYALGLRLAAERSFQGDRFPRGYYADGKPLGQNGACEIDAIVQAFAAVAGADRQQTRTALKTAFRELIDEENRLVRLFSPPFTQITPEKPGYIAAYPPGTRENGGQYTHGAIWLAWGAYLAGMQEEGDRIMRILCPTDRDTKVYRAEPYALCADVYASPAPAGRGGWSLYTGAAGWYYTIARRFLRN